MPRSFPKAPRMPEDAKLARKRLGILTAESRFRCPACKLTTGVNISYDFPTEELFEEAERNEAVL